MEIKPQELRIGNLISSKVNRRNLITVLQLFNDSYQADFGNGQRGGMMYSTAEGIELTPEWLTRFGFKRTQIYENVDEWYKKPLSLQTDQEIFMVTRIGTDDLELKHVHQLQNLFYALTGEELAIDKTSLKN